MKRRWWASCGLLVMVWSMVRGGEPPCIGYVEQCKTVNRTILNAVVTKTTCTKEVKEKKGYMVQTRDVPSEVPVTRMVPVCIPDPCTGHTRTVLRPETVMQKATTTYILVLPPEGPDTTRKEEHVTMKVNVLFGYTPAQVVERVPFRCDKKTH